MKPDTSLYFHIPFCTHRCAYCDFNTYARQEDMIPAYVDALCKEVEFVGKSLRSERSRSDREGVVEAHTIFFGGGTPSLLSPKQFESIFNAIHRNFQVTSDAEITIEANPGTVSFADLLNLRSLGINRISYGVQSANAEELRMLERIHTFFDVIEAVSNSRKAGFNNLNLDLIYGLPEQTLFTWQTTVRRILDLHPEHISAYALTLEHGTPFGRWSTKGILPLPDPDLAAEMYEWLSEMLELNGYVQYEISNWAKINAEGKMMNEESNAENSSRFAVIHHSSFQCRHNLQYWRGLPYLAFGAGAHGYANGYRYSSVLRIQTYIERITNYQLPGTRLPFPLSPATVNHHKQSPKDDMSEFMMTGLRLTQEGVSEAEFQARFGHSMRDIFGQEIDELLKLGLIEFVFPAETVAPVAERSGGWARGEGEILRISKHGRLLGNQVFMRFV